MAKLSTDTAGDVEAQERDKQKLQNQQEQYHQLQRDLADAISRLASLDDIRILLACGAKANGPVTQGLHPIHYAAYQNFVPAVRLLLLRGCDINAMDDNGYTAVHLCAERGYKELLEFLAANGAKVCFTDLRRQKSPNSIPDEPLSLALKRGHRDCAELLLKNGADPNARYFMGAEINQVSILELRSLELLLRYGAHPDSRDRSGLTPLMKAARHPQGYATVKLLIEYNADVNDIAGERHDYRTVLHHSIFSGNLDLIRLLLASGARYPKLEFDKPSPLDIAIISGRHDVVKVLIEFEADLNAGSGTTIGQPLHTALTQRVENKREIVRLLLDWGANPNSPTTSNRNTGPPLHDYLNAVRHCGAGAGHVQRTSSPGGSPSCSADSQKEFDLDMIRMLLMYGARVVLRSASQHKLGLVRTLERVQEELSLDMLHLLIEAAEEIDWPMMSKVVYSCLRHANRAQANELFDPSVSADMTWERLGALLAEPAAQELNPNPHPHLHHQHKHHHNRHRQGISDELVRLINRGRSSCDILSLKQLARLKIRKHLFEDKICRGHDLITRLRSLPIPEILTGYLLYQT